MRKYTEECLGINVSSHDIKYNLSTNIVFWSSTFKCVNIAIVKFFFWLIYSWKMEHLLVCLWKEIKTNKNGLIIKKAIKYFTIVFNKMWKKKDTMSNEIFKDFINEMNKFRSFLVLDRSWWRFNFNLSLEILSKSLNWY